MTGERIEFRDRTAEALRSHYYLAPDGFAMGKLDHVHPHQEERFEVRSGRLGVPVDGDVWTGTPGTRFAVLQNTPHTFWNDGSEGMYAVVELRPLWKLLPCSNRCMGSLGQATRIGGDSQVRFSWL